MKKIIICALLLWLGVRTEINFGTCLNEDGDGRVYNAPPGYDYISYRDTDVVEFDKVLTVLILNPLNTSCDDYIYRHDFVVRREY